MELFKLMQPVCLIYLYTNIFNIFQADPTKVESVHDVLARAVEKGLLGGIIPRESKKGKREKRRKDRKDPADSKPSSPSSHDEETGNEFDDDQEPVYATEHNEGEDEHEKRTGGKKGTKGRKQQVKRRAKRSATVSRKQQSDGKKPVKKKQQSQHRRHHRKRRARKIPRLTLSLMSSTKPSSSLSTITALAHKLSKNVALESQQILFSPRPPASGPHFSPHPAISGTEFSPYPPDSGPHFSSHPSVSLPAVLRRQNTDAGRAEKKVKNIKAGTSKTRAKVVKGETEVVTQVGSEAASLALPPISKPHHSFGSRSGSSGSYLHSQASRSKMSASSSTSLIGL